MSKDFIINPLISLVMPTYNTKKDLLKLAFESVLRQTYANWELCVADDASTQPETLEVLHHYECMDTRIKITYRKTNGHISAASNSAIEMVTGDYIALLDHDDELPDTALQEVVNEINKFPNAKLIYSDEDKIDESGTHSFPNYKSDYNPDLFLSQNMISHFGVYKTSIVKNLRGFRVGYEGSQDYDLALRVIENIQPSEIRHISKILYHWRITETSTANDTYGKPYAQIAAVKAIQDHLDRMNFAGKVDYAPLLPFWYRVMYQVTNNPNVNIIVPIINDSWRIHLRDCLQSIYKLTDWINYSVNLVVSSAFSLDIIRVFDFDNDFRDVSLLSIDNCNSTPCMLNQAFNRLDGDVMVLFDVTSRVIDHAWLSELVSHSIRNEVGIVGGKIVDTNNRIIHGGIIMGLGKQRIAGYASYGLHKNDGGYIGRANLIQNFSAVSGLCMAFRREVYLELNGFSQNYGDALYDIDFCLRATEKGYRNVYTPYSLVQNVVHRKEIIDVVDNDTSVKKWIDVFKSRWYEIIQNDPAYSINHSRDYCFNYPLWDKSSFHIPYDLINANDLPLISVLMPVNDFNEHFEKSLKSVLLQTYQNYEIIIGDYSGNSHGEEILEHFLLQHTNIHYLIINDCHDQIKVARQLIDYASGDLLNIFLNGDLMHPQKYEKMVPFLINDRELVLVTSHRQGIDRFCIPKPLSGPTTRLFPHNIALEGNALSSVCILNDINFIGEFSTVVFRKSALTNLLGTFLGREYRWSADLATWLTLLRNRKCVYISETLNYWGSFDITPLDIPRWILNSRSDTIHAILMAPVVNFTGNLSAQYMNALESNLEKLFSILNNEDLIKILKANSERYAEDVRELKNQSLKLFATYKNIISCQVDLF